MPLPVDVVQSTLASIGPMRQFKVVFVKKDGELREMVCMMDTDSGNRGASVPVIEAGTWKSFRVDSVHSINVL
jgi:hypothetical protein